MVTPLKQSLQSQRKEQREKNNPVHREYWREVRQLRKEFEEGSLPKRPVINTGKIKN